MRLRELELINSIMTLGSVSDAARANHMTQPNGSKMLKKLEEQFGFALFDRIHGRLRPREEMRQIWGHMEHTLLSLRHLNNLTRDVLSVVHLCCRGIGCQIYCHSFCANILEFSPHSILIVRVSCWN